MQWECETPGRQASAVGIRWQLFIQQQVHHHGLGRHKHGSQSARCDDTVGFEVGEPHVAVFYQIPTIVLRYVKVTVYADMQLETRIGAGYGG